MLIIAAACLQQNVAKREYQIHLKSQAGPIYVLLVNKDSDGSSPVVVQVPPPKEEMDVDALDSAAENNKQNGSQKATKVVILAYNNTMLCSQSSARWGYF